MLAGGALTAYNAIDRFTNKPIVQDVLSAVPGTDAYDRAHPSPQALAMAGQMPGYY